MKIRTRFAPSPTGFLHIGGLRTALYAYLFAKQNNGDCILRIEDTDQTRYVEGAVENLINSLTWAGIIFNEGPHIGGDFGPYIQSQRTEIYKQHINILLQNKSAYKCFCSKERLDILRTEQIEKKLQPKYDGHCKNLDENTIQKKITNNEPFVVRLKIPENQIITFNDIVRGEISFNTKDIDDQVLLKSDGFPTYHLANVVDDHLMQITHIIRAEEWLSSTPKHIILYKSFGWQNTIPQFAHLPLLLNTDRSKLSKRQNDVAVEDYKKQGYLPQSIVNFVALMGWNPGTDKEIFSIGELIKEFDINKVHKAGAVFNRQKLDWMNSNYIKNLNADDFYTKCIPYLKELNFDLSDENYIKSAVLLEQLRINRFDEIPNLIEHFFQTKLDYNKDLLKWKKSDLNEAKNRLNLIKNYINEYKGDWSIQNLEKEIKLFIEQNNLGVGNTLWPLRVSLCGKQNSPSPFELMFVLGKEKTIQRIEFAINYI